MESLAIFFTFLEQVVFVFFTEVNFRSLKSDVKNCAVSVFDLIVIKINIYIGSCANALIIQFVLSQTSADQLS